MTRPSWDMYALGLAQAAARRSEDPWLQAGAVVLRADHSVAGVGYNGAPSGIDIHWSNRAARRPFVIHAEVNALRYCTVADAAGGTLACTHSPCAKCMTVIASYAISRVVFEEWIPETTGDYARELIQNIADISKIELNLLEGA